MGKWIGWIGAAALAGASGMTAAATCTVTSPAHSVALVELYTSEGCSSCPPADDWLRGLQAAGYGFDRVVPLALHVDYWDYIGWKDPFASSRFSERQRAYSAIGNSRFIYTPQVVFDGRDFRSWHNSTGFERAVRAANAKPARATITVSLDEKAPGAALVHVGAELPKNVDPRSVALYVAAYESGLSNNVNAGENSGATLAHDYVVRKWFGPVGFDANGRAELAQQITRTAKGGVAAFVQAPHTGDVLQATALAHCGAS